MRTSGATHGVILQPAANEISSIAGKSVGSIIAIDIFLKLRSKGIAFSLSTNLTGTV
jgi:hypothetical protein